MRFWIGTAVWLALAGGFAAFVKNEYVFFAAYTVLMYVVLATAWNILGGYAGYVNFGAPAFFGLGAYTGAVLYKAFALPLGLQVLAAFVMSGLLGLFAVVLTLRLRGIFFAIARARGTFLRMLVRSGMAREMEDKLLFGSVRAGIRAYRVWRNRSRVGQQAEQG